MSTELSVFLKDTEVIKDRKIYSWYDGPMMSLVTGGSGNIYLEYCADIDPESVYLYFTTSASDLELLTSDKLTLRGFMMRSPVIYKTTVGSRDWVERKRVEFKDIGDMVPDDGIFLEWDGEYYAYG